MYGFCLAFVQLNFVRSGYNGPKYDAAQWIGSWFRYWASRAVYVIRTDGGASLDVVAADLAHFGFSLRCLAIE